MGGIKLICIGAALAVLYLLEGAGSPAFGQSCVSFGAVLGTTSEYDTYQIKFTWVGEQKESKPSFGVAGTSATFDPTNFVPCRLPSNRYGNDTSTLEKIHLSGAEIGRFLGKLQARADLQTTSVPSDGVLSWSILRPGAGGKIFEHVSTRVGAKTTMLLLIGSLDAGRTTEKDTIVRVKRIYVGDD